MRITEVRAGARATYTRPYSNDPGAPGTLTGRTQEEFFPTWDGGYAVDRAEFEYDADPNAVPGATPTRRFIVAGRLDPL